MYLEQQNYNGISLSLAQDILKHNQYEKHSCGWKINKSSRLS